MDQARAEKIHRQWRGECAGAGGTGEGEGDVNTNTPPAWRHEGVTVGDTVQPSPLCCEFHQNGAIRGGGRAEERRRGYFMSNCVIM